ncbi:hypothetical protein FA95DRAFT_1608424 [Auriscalpium vulgare]|uniref:Uncharacterized protein n=1 Tax=Auriscalpium vulgare TaxID=40419 RepID=A0ACB8RLV1_9AGAM|nr:hypothetical protein FA95DRAFT_1608424 [Auriscalpium vulgare]
MFSVKTKLNESLHYQSPVRQVIHPDLGTTTSVQSGTFVHTGLGVGRQIYTSELISHYPAADRPLTNVSSPSPNPSTIIVLIEDRRTGVAERAEVSVPLVRADGACYTADAQDVCAQLQCSPSRIEGAGKVYTMRGAHRQAIMRIDGDGSELWGSVPLPVDEESMTLEVFVESFDDVVSPKPISTAPRTPLSSREAPVHIFGMFTPAATPNSTSMLVQQMLSPGIMKRKRTSFPSSSTSSPNSKRARTLPNAISGGRPDASHPVRALSTSSSSSAQLRAFRALRVSPAARRQAKSAPAPARPVFGVKSNELAAQPRLTSPSDGDDENSDGSAKRRLVVRDRRESLKR